MRINPRLDGKERQLIRKNKKRRDAKKITGFYTDSMGNQKPITPTKSLVSRTSGNILFKSLSCLRDRHGHLIYYPGNL